MSKQKRLKVMGAADAKLGQETIMDRALAQRYGAPYVHAAAFAIDLDRLRDRYADDPRWPFAFEVLLTEVYLSRHLAGPEYVPLLEDMCLHVLDLPRTKGDAPGPLGTQLPFAVYAGVAHKLLPAALGQCFHVWKKPPTDLLAELDTLRAQPNIVATLCAMCLAAPLEPSLVEPVRAALVQLSAPAGESSSSP